MALNNYYTGLEGADLSGLYNYGITPSYNNLSGADLGGYGTNTFNTGGGLNWFGQNGILGGLGNLALGGLQGYTALRSLGLANKELQLNKQKFNFERGLANRNIANQAQTINNAYNSSAQAAIGLMGGINALTGQYTAPSEEAVASVEQRAKDYQVNSSPIR